MKIVLYYSLFFYIAVVEFAFGAVERGMREDVNPLVVTCILYSNAEIFLLSVNRSEDSSLKRLTDSAPNKGCSIVRPWMQPLGFGCRSPFL